MSGFLTGDQELITTPPPPLPSRSLQGRPQCLVHSVRQQKEEMWDRGWETVRKGEGGGGGGGVKCLCAPWGRWKKRQREWGGIMSRETMIDSDVYNDWEEESVTIQGKQENVNGIYEVEAEAQSDSTELYKLLCWSMEKWAQPQQSIPYWHNHSSCWDLGLFFCLLGFFLGCQNEPINHI